MLKHKYDTDEVTTKVVVVLRRFVHKLICWPRTPESDISGLAKCLIALHEFPTVNRQFNVVVTLSQPPLPWDNGELSLAWHVHVAPGEIEASIVGCFRCEETGSDSVTTCEFYASQNAATSYDDYRRVHGDHSLPVLSVDAIADLDLSEPGVEMSVEDSGT